MPLAYTVGKRCFRMRGSALRTFLTIHIYAGLVGPILVVLHTGHKFDNPLGVLLTAMTLSVVLSGFVGRYLLRQTTYRMQEKQDELARFQSVFDAVQNALGEQAEQVGMQTVRRGVFLSALLPWAVRNRQLRDTGRQGVQLARAMAVLEVSMALHKQIRRWFRVWMRFHLTLTTVLYLLLAMHVFVVFYYGLRWLPE
jgi:hypothetical protein